MNKTRPDLKGCTRNSNHFAVCINFLMQMYIQLYFYWWRTVYIIYSCCKLAIMWWWFLNLAWNKHVISEIAIIMWSKLGYYVGCNVIFWANKYCEHLVLQGFLRWINISMILLIETKQGSYFYFEISMKLYSVQFQLT